ncbi:trypsin-like peptidase domain-containing protein [Pelagibacterales bacterium SAG-MED29]|nr:trypsin-like peptidase domain-containing protein [Pelagibacterales bacterium SAG-MED29]
MIKRFLILFITISYGTAAYSENFNSLIFSSKMAGKENLVIYQTPLTNKKQINQLKQDIETDKDYLNIIRPKLISKNKNRPPRTKFKGASEDIYKDYAKSVVFIGNRKKSTSGSGFVINHKGKKIITNWHVVEGSKSVKVWLKPKDLVAEQYMLDNLDSYEARVVKIDKEKDLALLEVVKLPNDIKPVTLGNFNDVSIGETVFAIGHPDDLIWSFSSGMVSQLRPNYKWKYKNSFHFADVIQTQTPINPGNSGGPLFNKNKKLVGVNTFTKEGENLNFAISVNDVVEFLKKPEKKIKKNNYIQKKKKEPTWITKKNKKAKKNSIDKKYPDAEKRDMNKNGITDVWFIDENKNGKIDAAIIDQNEDGIVEAVAFDENENENFEIFLFDDDLDGNADRAEIDEDDNGTADIMAYDNDQDGKWDKYEKIS